MTHKKLYIFFSRLLSFKFELFWILAGLVIQLFSGIFTIKILTNYLSTNDYGIYILINSIIQFLEIVVFSSLIQGAAKFSYYLKDISHSFEFARKTSLKIFYFLFFVSVFTSLVFIYLGKIDLIYYCFLILSLIYFDVNRDIIIGIFHMDRSRKQVTLFRSSDQFLRMILLIILGLLGLINVKNIFLGFILTTSLVFFVLIKKKANFHAKESVSYGNLNGDKKEKLKQKVLRFALPFALTSIFTWVLTWADRWVLNLFLSVDKVGSYSANSQIANVPFMIISSIALTFFTPIIYKKVEKLKVLKDFENLKNQLIKILVFYLVISFLIFLMALLFEQNILNYLLTKDFVINNYLFIVISLGWLLYQIAQVQAAIYLYSTGGSKEVLISTLISGIFYVITLIFLVNIFGEIGAGYSFVLSSLLRILLQFILAEKSWKSFGSKILQSLPNQ